MKAKAVQMDDAFETMFSEGIEASSAFLHQTILAKNFPAERTLSQSKIPGAVMMWTPAGLLIKYKGVRIVIPSANVANVVV